MAGMEVLRISVLAVFFKKMFEFLKVLAYLFRCSVNENLNTPLNLP